MNISVIEFMQNQKKKSIPSKLYIVHRQNKQS